MQRVDNPTATNALYPHAGPLLADRWNEDLIRATWDDMLRMAGSLKFGEATASLVVGKWSAASRQNTLAAAIKELGAHPHARSMPPGTCQTRCTGGRSPGSSTRARACTRCAGTCTTPSKARSSGPT
ncbi:hypothetical protein GCM10018952_74250 [Streptosporangium vulgare]